MSAWTRGSGSVFVAQYNAAGACLVWNTPITVTSGYVSLERQVGSFVAVAGATQVDIWLQSTGAYGAAFDNVRMEKVNALGSDNWVENESMEYRPPSGPAYHWSLYNGVGYQCDNVGTGGWGDDGICLQIYGAPGTQSDAGQWWGQRIRVSPGESYSASLLMKTSAIKAYGPTGEWGGAYAQVAMYADDVTQYPSAFVDLTPRTSEDLFIQGDTDWTRYTARIDVPAGVTSLEIFAALYQAEGWVWIDHAGLERASDVATYGYDSTHTFRTIEDTTGKRRLESDFDSRGRATESRYGATRGVAATSTVTSNTYDGLDRLTKVESAQGSGLNIDAHYTYTDAGRLATVTDPLDHVTTMDYDSAGRLSQATSPGGLIAAMDYDGLGRLARTLRPRRSGEATVPLTQTTYDTVSRPTTTTFFSAGGVPVATDTLSYDKLSRVKDRVLAGDTAATAHADFDVLGRVSAWNTTGPSGDASGTTIYDLADLPTKTTWGALGTAAVIDNTYAKTNQWLSTKAFGTVWSFTTAVDGSVPSIVSALGASARDFDATRHLSAVHTRRTSGTTLSAFADHALTYDGRDRIWTATTNVTATGATSVDTYGYDAADRLSTWARTGTAADSASWTYRADGAMDTAVRAGVTTTFAYDTDDRLTSTVAGGVTTIYTNDDLGRRTSRVSPSQATTPTKTATYSYGASGMREKKAVASAGATSTTSFLYAGMQLMAERDSDGTLLRYLYGPGGVPLELSVTATSGVTTSFAYQLDHSGSVIGLTDSAGGVVATYAYDPWGNPTSVGGSNAWLAARQPLRYRGYYLDAETGLYYLPARFYDPAVARFLSADPAPPSAGDPGSRNRYVYCQDDPVNREDPTGEDPPGKAVTERGPWPSGVPPGLSPPGEPLRPDRPRPASPPRFARRARSVETGRRTLMSAPPPG